MDYLNKVCLCSIIFLVNLWPTKSESEASNNFKFDSARMNHESNRFGMQLTSQKHYKRSVDEDEIFKQLDIELKADITERIQSQEEERKESEKIFQELINETSTPKAIKNGDKDSETIQKITDTVAKLVLRGKKDSADNSNILGTLTNLFNLRNRFLGK